MPQSTSSASQNRGTPAKATANVPKVSKSAQPTTAKSNPTTDGNAPRTTRPVVNATESNKANRGKAGRKGSSKKGPGFSDVVYNAMDAAKAAKK